MVGSQKAVSVGGGGGSDLAGYASQAWVDQFYLSKEFFNRLFTIHGTDSNNDPTTVLPNDTTTTITSIEAMFGFWTELYVSALGNGGQIGGSIYLSQLADVALNNPTNGQALVYDSTTHKWVNGQASGVDMSTVWSNLAAATSEQINASHLSNALSSYVTSSALSSTLSDYVTTTALGTTLASYATQTWVSQNYISIAYFDRLFRAYNGSTLVSHNDTTTTIDNIKAMFGFWTEYYLSALGNGGQAGSAIYLSQLADVVLTSPTNGQALVYDAQNQQWVNGTISSGVSSLANLSDVLISAPSAGQTLTYDAVSAKWQNTSLTTSLLSDIVLSSISSNQVLIWDSTNSRWVNTSLKTINYQSIIGSGDIQVGGGASGNYLPLTGGTMAGSILKASGISADIGDNTNFFDNASINRVYTHHIDSIGIDSGTLYFNYYGSGNILFSNGNVMIGSGTPSYKLQVNGDAACNTLYLKRFNDNDYRYMTIGAKGTSGTDAYTLHIANGSSSNVSIDLMGGNIFANGDVYCNNNMYLGNDSNWHTINVIRTGVGTGNIGGIDGSGLYFQHTTYGGSSSYMYLKGGEGLNISGSIYATGAVTALSDARHKTIIKDVDMSVEDISRMPAVMYQWNDGREDKDLHVGSIAQDWQSVLPQVVLRANDKEGTLSMSYGVAGLISAIVTARKVVEHERRIAELERENKELKERLKVA